MKAAPSKALETVIGFLIPPACREHVLGDLRERYTCPRRYIADAVDTVPRLVVSQIRRRTAPQVFLMEASALYLSFLAATWQSDSTEFHEQRAFLRLAIPTVAALVGLLLGDAYASPGKRSPLMPIMEASVGVACAFLSQAAVSAADRELVVPRWIMVSGGGMSLLLVSTLRMLFPPAGNRPRGAT